MCVNLPRLCVFQVGNVTGHLWHTLRAIAFVCRKAGRFRWKQRWWSFCKLANSKRPPLWKRNQTLFVRPKSPWFNCQSVHLTQICVQVATILGGLWGDSNERYNKVVGCIRWIFRICKTDFCEKQLLSVMMTINMQHKNKK